MELWSLELCKDRTSSMAFTCVTAMGSLERVRSNILCHRVGKCSCWVRAFSVMHAAKDLCACVLGQVILGHWIPGRLKSPKRTIYSLLSVRKVIKLHMLS